MARNGSGTYSIPNTMVAGAVITASDHNENYSDIGAELTNSVAKDGQTTMTGALKASNGTAAAPSITFGADADTGAYRSASNEWSVAAGGSQVLKVSSLGVDAASGQILQGGFALVPTGSIVDFAGDTAPDGWLFCGGQAVSRTTYAALFVVISDGYGIGDGSTTFNLPDLCGRVVAGRDNMGGASANRLTNQSGGLNGDTLGATGGAETHTITAGESAVLTYTSAVTDPQHGHNVNVASTAAAAAGSFGGSGINVGTPGGTVVAAANSTGITVGTTANAGGGAHNNVQPTIILNKIIKY